MLPAAQKVVKAVEAKRGVSIEIIDLATMTPLDSQTIVDSVRETGRCVIVQEAPRSFSVGSEIIARINDGALMYLQAPVRRVSSFDIITPYFQREKEYLPTATRIQQAIEETLDYR
jgi:pyruvate dehydrogenase E1 component beta subunit